MKLHASRGSRRLSLLPTFLVVALWFVLWKAWPTEPQSAERRKVSGSRVAYVAPGALGSDFALMPLAFVSTPFAPDPLVEEEGFATLQVLRPDQAGHRLERAGSPANAAGGVSALLATLVPTNAAYRPVFDAPRVFEERPPREWNLTVDLAAGLKERGFVVKPWTAAELGWTNSAWQVILRVECAEDGGVDDVFVEAGTANQAFNLALARRVQSSGKALPGARCRGVMTVRYGGE
jgi:hypothetical protein